MPINKQEKVSNLELQNKLNSKRMNKQNTDINSYNKN